jgi:O-antigen/teichoic acid export membrane protein
LKNLSTDITAAVVSSESLWSRFQTGIAYNTIGAVFNQGSTFAVSIIVANFLGKQIFGEYAIVQTTVATVAVIAQAGISYTATKYVAEYRAVDRDRTGRILGMILAFSAAAATVATLALVLLAPWLASRVFKAPALGAVLAIGSAVLLFAALNGSLMGALYGLESYKALATALVWSGLCYLLACTVLAWWAGLKGAIGGQALSGLFQFVLLGFVVRRECAKQRIKIRLSNSAKESRIVLHFGLPAALGGLTSMPALWLGSAFLVRQANGYSQMGIYGASFALMIAVLFLPNIANNVGMSLINNHKGGGDAVEYRRTFWINFVLTLTAVALGAAAAAVAGPELLRLFGKDFKEGYGVLLILLLAAVSQGFAVAMYQVIQSQARMWLSFFAVALPRDTLIVVLAHLLIPLHGARGLATAYAIACTVAAVVTAVIVWQIGLESTGVRQTARGENIGGMLPAQHAGTKCHRSIQAEHK